MHVCGMFGLSTNCEGVKQSVCVVGKKAGNGRIARAQGWRHLIVHHEMYNARASPRHAGKREL